MECLARGSLDIGRGDIEKIVLTDLGEPVFQHKGLLEDARVSTRYGNISDEQFVQSLFDEQYDAVFHLASIVSGHGEQDFDLALGVNLDGTRYLFEGIRHQNNNARVVFASSIASFGGDTMPDLSLIHI